MLQPTSVEDCMTFKLSKGEENNYIKVSDARSERIEHLDTHTHTHVLATGGACD